MIEEYNSKPLMKRTLNVVVDVDEQRKKKKKFYILSFR